MKLLLIWSMFISSVLASKIDLNTYSTSLDFAQVTQVIALQRTSGSWCFNTSVRHNDQDWQHYADGWEVIDLNGNKLATRVLGHPHVNEQPFTRSKCGINIPANITKVAVRAKCTTHGFGGKAIIIDLKNKQGEGYSVSRSQ